MSILGQMPASAWKAELDNRTGRLMARFRGLYGDDPDLLTERLPLYHKALDTFIHAHGGDRDVIISRAPGRINLLGNHIEHRGGRVNYVAVNRETLLVASARNDDTVTLCNALPERFSARSFRIADLLPPDQRGRWLDYIPTADIKLHDWENYVRAAVLHLQDHFPDTPIKGMDLAVAGDIPIAAGLSSSSSLVVSTLEAALHFNRLEIPHRQKAEFCGRAEWYAGTRGGAGDHAAMLYARRQAVVHLQFFPLDIREIPLPEGYRIVACNSLVEHAPPGIFNERIATYEIGLLLVKKHAPHFADRLVHLRDLNAAHLGVPLSEIYRILKALPERMSRAAIRSALPEHSARLDALFAPHAEPEGGYRLRQVVFFGLAECARGAQCAALLEAGDMAGFGRLKTRSHDGDRQFRYAPDGTVRPIENRLTDAALDRLTADLKSGDPGRVEAAQLYNQPGGYDCSCEALDRLVDLADAVEGVVGSGLTGGGLGGCVLVFVRNEAVDALIAHLDAHFYAPKKCDNGTLICASVGGSGLI